MEVLDNVMDLLYSLDIMFARKHSTRKADGTVVIRLGLARSYRRKNQVCQEQLCHLGRLDRLIRSLARYSCHQWVMLEEAPDDVRVCAHQAKNYLSGR